MREERGEREEKGREPTTGEGGGTWYSAGVVLMRGKRGHRGRVERVKGRRRVTGWKRA